MQRSSVKRRRMLETSTDQDTYEFPSDPPSSRRDSNSRLEFSIRMRKGISSTGPVATSEKNAEEPAGIAENGLSETRRTRKRKAEVMDGPAGSKALITSTAESANSVEHAEGAARGQSHSKPATMQSSNTPAANARRTRSNPIGPFIALEKPKRSRTERMNHVELPSSSQPRAPDQPSMGDELRPIREESEVPGEVPALNPDELPSVEDIIEAQRANDKGQQQRESSGSEFDDGDEQSAEEPVEEGEGDDRSEANVIDTQQSQSRPSEPSRPRKRTSLPALKNRELRSHAGKIREAMEALKGVGLQTRGGSTIRHPLPLNTKIVKDLVMLARQTKKIYDALPKADPQELEECIKTLNDSLDDIRAKIDSITEGQAKKNDNESSTVVDLYAHAIPRLVRLLHAAFVCYTEVECQGTAGLEQIVRIIDLVQLLIQKASDWKPRPDPSLRVVQPIRQGVRRPLREMKKDLERVIVRKKREANQKAYGAEAGIDGQKDVEKNRRNRAESEQLIRERHLLIERQLKEVEARQTSTQRSPSHSKQQDRRQRQRYNTNNDDEDGGGESFERVQVFHPPGRPGPRAEGWSWSEIKALVEGLERFTGPDRYTCILQANNRPDQALRSRNFDELVRKAKELKGDYLIELEQHPKGRRAPDWLLSV